jgi:hypothetical protein
MSELSTSAREAIRIAEKYLPNETIVRREALAQEIVRVVNICEAELGAEIIRRMKA